MLVRNSLQELRTKGEKYDHWRATSWAKSDCNGQEKRPGRRIDGELAKLMQAKDWHQMSQRQGKMTIRG